MVFDCQPSTRPPGVNGIVSDYEHSNSVLRGSVTGAKGDVVFVNPEQGDEQQFDFEFPWNSDWMMDNCDVIAILTSMKQKRTGLPVNKKSDMPTSPQD